VEPRLGADRARLRDRAPRGAHPVRLVRLEPPVAGAEDGALDLYDGVLRAVDKDGNTIADGVDYQRYLDLLSEEVRSWSYMKFPFLKSLGPERGFYRVGPLARLNTASFIDTPEAEKARVSSAVSPRPPEQRDDVLPLGAHGRATACRGDDPTVARRPDLQGDRPAVVRAASRGGGRAVERRAGR